MKRLVLAGEEGDFDACLCTARSRARSISIYIRRRSIDFPRCDFFCPFYGSGKHGEAHLGEGGCSGVYRAELHVMFFMISAHSHVRRWMAALS